MYEYLHWPTTKFTSELLTIVIRNHYSCWRLEVRLGRDVRRSLTYLARIWEICGSLSRLRLAVKYNYACVWAVETTINASVDRCKHLYQHCAYYCYVIRLVSTLVPKRRLLVMVWLLIGWGEVSLTWLKATARRLRPHVVRILMGPA